MRTVVLWVSCATLFLAPKQNQSLSIKTTIIMVRMQRPRLATTCSSRNFCWVSVVYIFLRSLNGKEIQFSLLTCLSFLSIHAHAVASDICDLHGKIECSWLSQHRTSRPRCRACLCAARKPSRRQTSAVRTSGYFITV